MKYFIDIYFGKILLTDEDLWWDMFLPVAVIDQVMMM